MIIGLDVGGTHTDVVLLSSGGLEKRVKVLTDTSDLFSTVLTGLDRITENIDPRQITHTVLSTTLTTNAIVESKLPPVGMIITCGPGLHPDNYRIGDHFHIVSGAIDHSGSEIQAIDENQVMAAAEKMASSGISHVGVVGKFSTRNPAHEKKICNSLHRVSPRSSRVTAFQATSIFPGALPRHI
jgi:N-methylhydantoinase A